MWSNMEYFGRSCVWMWIFQTRTLFGCEKVIQWQWTIWPATLTCNNIYTVYMYSCFVFIYLHSIHICSSLFILYCEYIDVYLFTDLYTIHYIHVHTFSHSQAQLELWITLDSSDCRDGKVAVVPRNHGGPSWGKSQQVSGSKMFPNFLAIDTDGWDHCLQNHHGLLWFYMDNKWISMA